MLGLALLCPLGVRFFFSQSCWMGDGLEGCSVGWSGLKRGTTAQISYIYVRVNLSETQFVEDMILKVKLLTIWTDGKAEVGRVREEKRRREKIREEKERRCRCAKM